MLDWVLNTPLNGADFYYSWNSITAYMIQCIILKLKDVAIAQIYCKQGLLAVNYFHKKLHFRFLTFLNMSLVIINFLFHLFVMTATKIYPDHNTPCT